MNKALNDLIELGTTKKNVKVFGKTWRMRTLDTKDQLAVTNSTSDYDNLSRVVALKVAIVANAIDQVDGQSLGNKSERRDLFNKLPVPVVNQLYQEYEKLLDAQHETLNNLLEQDKENDESDESEGKAKAKKAEDDDDNDNEENENIKAI